MKRIILLILMIVPVLVVAQKKPPKDKLLDKKKFTITVTLVGKKKAVSFDDEMSFRSGKMGTRKMQSEQGFRIGEYVVTDKLDMDGDLVLKVQGINKNAKNQSLKWEITVFGDKIEGKAFVSKKGKVKKEYFFAGDLKVRGKRKK